MEQTLWSLSEKVSARLKANALAGTTVTLKLKSVDFKIRTRAESLGAPTQLATRIFAVGQRLLRREIGTVRYRLIGIGVSNLEDAEGSDFSDLLGRRDAQAEQAVDLLRRKFGRAAVLKGLAIEDE
jgi:DNA polymerase-4